MGAFFALLGAVLGYSLGYRFSPTNLIISILLILVSSLFAYRKGKLPIFLVAMVSFFLFRLIPWQGEEGQLSISGIVIYAKNNYYIVQSGLARYYIYEKGCLREVGDILSISGYSAKFIQTTYEGRFDFGEYLYAKGVIHEIKNAKAVGLFEMPFRFREKELAFLSSFGKEASGLLDSLLFNRKDYENSAIELASSLGVMNVLSSSGLIYGTFLRGGEKLFGLKFKERTSSILTLAMGLLLLPFNLGKIGVWRVFLTRFMKEIASHFSKRKFNHLELTSFSGVLLMIVDPKLSYETGFLLGYGASFFSYFASGKVEKGLKSKLFGMIRMFFFLLPFSISLGDVHPLFLFFSIVILPFSLTFSIVGYISFFTVPFVSFLTGFSSFIMGLLRFLSKADFSFSLPEPSSYLVVFYYFFLLFISFVGEIGWKRLRVIAVSSFFGLYLIGLTPIMNFLIQSVAFINVGQGDSILLQDGDKAVMIDTGGSLQFDMADEVLIPYLKRRRIYHLDALITTHGDFDHNGAVSSLLNNFSVSRFIDDRNAFPLKIGSMVIENLNENGSSKEDNDGSLVLYLPFMDKEWLFMGDASVKVEKEIIKEHPNLDCDILKLGHHGSKTSTCYEFLDAVTPEEAIISAGAKNSYGHPDDEVLKRLRNRNIKIRRTDIEGTIAYQKILGPLL